VRGTKNQLWGCELVEMKRCLEEKYSGMRLERDVETRETTKRSGQKKIESRLMHRNESNAAKFA
jgi:hypothetical protein